MTDIGIENINPDDDREYAKTIAVDIKEWVIERFGTKDVNSFRQPDCKEHFMKISERFITMACSLLVDEGFLSLDGKRIPVYTMTELGLAEVARVNAALEKSRLEEAEVAAATAAVKQTKRVSRKRKVDDDTMPEDCIDHLSEDEEEEEVNGDSETQPPRTSLFSAVTGNKSTLSDLRNVRSLPFSLLCGEASIDPNDSNLVVHDLPNASAQQLPSVTSQTSSAVVNSPDVANPPPTWAVFDLISRIIDPSTQSCDYESLVAQAQTELAIDKDSVNQSLEQLEQMNKIMRIDPDILMI